MPRILAPLLCLALLGAACGEDQAVRETSPTTEAGGSEPASTDLEEVEVTEGEDGEAPTLTFDQPFSVEETSRRIVTEGDGDEVAVNSLVTFDFMFVNGRDGSQIGSSFEGEPTELVFQESLMPGVFQGLEGVPAGSQVLVAIAPGDGAGADESTGLLETDTVLFYADVIEVRETLLRAEGEAVPPVDGLPTVKLGANGEPTITMVGGEPPADLVVQPLIIGDGPEVESGQTITVHYTGALWANGTVFDASWASGAPTSFEIGTGAVIAGWDEGLVGQTVGSQILLVVPPEKGYPEGSPDGAIQPGDTIVFVVDILDAR
jgi:peptidylprolyl isomerase